MESSISDTTKEQLQKRADEMKNIIFLIYIHIMKTINYRGLRARPTYEEK